MAPQPLRVVLLLAASLTSRAQGTSAGSRNLVACKPFLRGWVQSSQRSSPRSLKILRQMATRREFGLGMGLGTLGGLMMHGRWEAEAAQNLQPKEQSTIRVFSRSTPGVVYIDTFTANRMRTFEMDPIEVPAGTGSGIVWDKEGHIVTNFHVIRNAQTARVTVTGINGQSNSFPAKLVGYDPDKDLAVLKIDAPPRDMVPLEKGSSSDLSVGQEAIAIGNPFGLDHTLTVGVVSGLGRQVMSPSGRPIFNVVQTDASINPGNSGGPLLNSNGDIIGINTAIFSPSGASSGVGFAIPVDTVKSIVGTLIDQGQVLRPQMGVSLFDSRALKAFGLDVKGIAVLEVIPGSAAAEAGLIGMSRLETGDLQVGDIITGIDNKMIVSESDLYRILDDYRPGDTIRVSVLRSGTKKMEVSLTLGAAKLAPLSFQDTAENVDDYSRYHSKSLR